jgi:drug/metabolite transporter (DMT)-like permease
MSPFFHLEFSGIHTHLQGMSDYFKERGMIAGIVLIAAGILLVVYPPLLSIIVAAVLILAGAMALSVAHYNRKVQRHFDNPTVEFFFRY